MDTPPAIAPSAASSPTMPLDGLDGTGDVLWFARDCRRAADLAEAQLLQAALVWAEQHPVESLDDAAILPGRGHEALIAGDGAPGVAEFCIAEFAAAVGMSTDAGRVFLGAAVELGYRLPRTWARVRNGSLPAWRARRIAEKTMILSQEAAAFVDAQVAPFAHRIGIVAVERLVEEAIGRFMPDLAREQAQARADGRRFEIHDRQVSFDGTCDVVGELDLADALDLEAAIAAGAEALKAAGSAESLPVRRARAAGELARAQLALALNHDHDQGCADDQVGDGDGAAESTPAADAGTLTTKTRRRPRQVVIYAHLAADAITGTGCRCGNTANSAAGGEPLQVARVENRRQVVTADQVREWCANPDTSVVVKPVIDLTEHVHVGAYEVPDRLAEQAHLRDLTCVFPHCQRAARRCDCDHVIEHPTGPTCSCNIAPLCRRHHRLKTHSTWRYTVLEPGSYLWSSPHGYQFLRDHQGTRDVTPPDRVPPRLRHLYPPPD